MLINASNEGIRVEFGRNNNTKLSLPTFKLPASTNNPFIVDDFSI